MRQRCLNPNHPKFKDYGGRGLVICERWNNFENFLADMGEAPHGLTLERKNNERGYFKKNCHWATARQQARNTRRNRLVTLDGRTKTLTEWAEEIGVLADTLKKRLNRELRKV